MDLITLDYETFYGTGYTLSSMTTEAYVRDPRFEAILLGVKINAERTYWVPRDEIRVHLHALNLPKRGVLMHHAHFDGLITSHHYGIYPKMYFDTLGMARALHGAHGRLSLAQLATRYGIGRKGEEVLNAREKRYKDFTPVQLAKYGDYCANDVELTYELFMRMAPQFGRSEMELNDQLIRMFTEPTLLLDADMLAEYAKEIRAEKVTLMLQAGVQEADLMSNPKFAQVLMDIGVDPPMKVSPTTGLQTYAFAKTDVGMQALQEHPDERVQILVEARLKNKTTIAERGAERLVAMSGRGPATVYLKYSGASGTHRFSGGDRFNWQSMKRGSKLRKAVKAPDGYVVVVGDSSNIEARMLDWLAGQDDMIEVYRAYDRGEGPDVYCVVAERIYKRPISKESDPDERQMGKVAKLGLGYGMGWVKFILSVRGQARTKEGKPLVLSQQFAVFVVDVYRSAHQQVQKLWKRCDAAIEAIAKGLEGVAVDFRGVVKTCKDGLVMPGGLKILFPELKREKDPETGRMEWSFWNGKTRERIYGAKMCENIIQCLARLVVMEQCLATKKAVGKAAKWVHSVHDEGVFLCHAFVGPWVRDVLLACMRVSPSWAPDLPLNSEGGFHQRYGMAKK